MIRNEPPMSDLFPRMKVLVIPCSWIVIIVFFVWSLSNYQPTTAFYGPRAIYSMILLSLLLVLLGRVLLLRLLKLEMSSRHSSRQYVLQEWRSLFLFDIAAPFYLAAGVLIGVPAAVLMALTIQMALQTYTYLRGYVSRNEAFYKIATTMVLVFVTNSTYTWVAGATHLSFVNTSRVIESRELLGSVLAALVMLLLMTIISLPVVFRLDWRNNFSLAWRDYLSSPFLRFQALILSVGPLLPVVDIFDDAVAELAWLFFLIPLFAIYYLALTSTRLSVQTQELQHTLEDLRSARRRQGELRDYASLITRVQEEERRRLARELHDDTAQALIALSLGLDGLGRAMRQLALPKKDLEWHANLQDLAESTLESVRRACRDLRPSVLDDLGLRAALEWLSDSSSTRGIPSTFTYTGEPLLASSEAEIAIFRIVQEALSNVWRHAHATQASVELEYLVDSLKVIVRDNGNGFFPGDAIYVPDQISPRGLGLLGMRERATLIGASLSIISSPNHGCTVTLALPLEVNASV